MSDWSSDVCSSDLDLLTFSQACEDLGVVRGLLARLHFSRLITALVEREHDERSLAGSNQRLRWPAQRGLRTATERYRREHAWLKANAAVGKFAIGRAAGRGRVWQSV